MVFKDYKFKCWKKEIKQLLQKRLALKDKIRYHRQKADNFENQELPKVEEELNKYLEKAGNKI